MNDARRRAREAIAFALEAGRGRGRTMAQTRSSGTLVETLLDADLVDELRLMVFPTLLGRGKRLFPDGIARLKLKLVEAKTVGSDGVQVQIHRRAE